MDKNMILSFVALLREIYSSKENYRILIDFEKFFENYADEEAYFQPDKNKQSQTNNLTFNQEMNYVKNTFGNEQFNVIAKEHNLRKVDEINYNERGIEFNSNRNKKFTNPEQKEENGFGNNKLKNELINNQQQNININLKIMQLESQENKKNKNSEYLNEKNFFNYIEDDRKDEEENSWEDNYENLEIRTLASQNITSGEKIKKYSFSKTYETDRDDKPDSAENHYYSHQLLNKNSNTKTPQVENKNLSNKKNANNSPLRNTNIRQNIMDKSPTKGIVENKSHNDKYNQRNLISNQQKNKREYSANQQSKMQTNENLKRNPSIQNLKNNTNTNQPIKMKIPNSTKLDIIPTPSRPITPTRGRNLLETKKANASNLLDLPTTNRNILDLSNLSNDKSRSVSPTPSCSDIEKNNHSYLYIRNNKDMLQVNSKFDYNKLYSKRERAEMNLIRGALVPTSNSGSTIGSKINHQVEINNYKLNLFKFLRPTLPIININFTSSLKYEPSAEYLKNSIIIKKSKESNKEKSNRKGDYMNIEENRDDDDPISELEIHNNIRETEILNKYNSEIKTDYSTGLRKLAPGAEYLKRNQTELSQFSKNQNQAISATLKNKIYFWLVDLNILKENAIEVDDIPLLCTNGVLLCDLINRLEGKTETIKGIIRKTTTKTHIQININKVLEYLRNIGKVNNRHLWSGMEIASGDEKSIWEFLDDIWYFFSNKNHDIANRRRKKKIPILVAPMQTNLNSDSNLTKLELLQNFTEKIQQRIKEEPIELREIKAHNNVNIKLNHHEIREEIEKCADLATLQKNISEEISYALNKTSKQSNTNLTKRSESNDKFTNSEIIAKNLGLTKIKKKGEPISNISRIANSQNNSNQSISHQYPFLKKAQSNKNIPPCESSRPGSARSNLNSRTIMNNPKTLTNNDSKSKDKKKDCFVIFQKTNAKKLQREIERYHSLVSASAYNSENSIMGKNEDTKSVVDQFNFNNKSNINDYENKLIPNNKKELYNENFNLPRPYTTNQLKPMRNHYSPHEFPILLTEESHHPSKIHKVCSSDVERDEMILKEWLMNIGSKSAYKIDFTNEEIEVLKDGILLAEIISILENKKVPGINENAKSKEAGLKNISKCLEILRNKKVKFVFHIYNIKNMPFDYLWSEEEIAKGNLQVIKTLLKQMKKAYQKESEFIKNQINQKV